MPIRSIEIICRPCPKCSQLEQDIRKAIKQIEAARYITIPFDFRHTVDLAGLTNHGLSPAQTPAVVINDLVEFAGRIESGIIKNKLEHIHFSG